jgi:ABC-type molybdate transport system ATPase subunit
VLAAHNPRLLPIADRVVTLAAGRVVAAGPVVTERRLAAADPSPGQPLATAPAFTAGAA